jgi:hypothetical protein
MAASGEALIAGKSMSLASDPPEIKFGSNVDDRPCPARDPPVLARIDPPIELASSRLRGQLDLDVWIDI